MLTDEELSAIYHKYLGEIQIAATGLTDETYPPLDVLEDIAGLFNEVERLRAENEELKADLKVAWGNGPEYKPMPVKPKND